jgi:uridine kinase
MEKGKLTDKPFFLIINGPSCGGKSTVSKIIHEKWSEIYLASGDKIKWQISDYKSSVYMGAVYKMVLATIKVALQHGLSILKEGAFIPT